MARSGRHESTSAITPGREPAAIAQTDSAACNGSTPCVTQYDVCRTVGQRARLPASPMTPRAVSAGRRQPIGVS